MVEWPVALEMRSVSANVDSYVGIEDVNMNVTHNVTNNVNADVSAAHLVGATRQRSGRQSRSRSIGACRERLDWAARSRSGMRFA